MRPLEHKTALVTGSARGIGRAIAERYAALGANVVINYATGQGPARDTVSSIEQAGGTALAVQANVAHAEDVERLFESTLERFGSRRCDGFVDRGDRYNLRVNAALRSDEPDRCYHPLYRSAARSRRGRVVATGLGGRVRVSLDHSTGSAPRQSPGLSPGRRWVHKGAARGPPLRLADRP